MADRLIAKQQIKKFGGVKSGIGSHAVGDGLRAGINVGATVPGVAAAVRAGMRVVEFEDGSASSNYDVLACFAFHGPECEWVIYFDSAGNIIAGRAPQ